jgi:mono/diheme cytochrome c family protein
MGIMVRKSYFIASLFLVVASVLGASLRSQEAKKPAPLPPAAVQFFETKIRPVFVENCVKCHGDKKPKADLRLDSLAGMLSGGDQGPAIVPGDPEKSLLIKAIRHDDRELKMPPTGKLTKDQIADITQWVKMGAPWPGADKGTVVRKGEFQITDKDRAHWAFQPRKRPAVPQVKNKGWVTNPIDSFILAQLEAKGPQPNPPASKQELIRRVYYDLTGLPPTPQEVDSFVNDASPKSYELLLDRLLSSPRYGEKWGRHWLDLVRFAETNSYERDNPKPHAWRFRDYVIRAFNQDKPYDQFVREQLAGDELGYPEAKASGLGQDADAIIATGFYRLGIWDDEPSDPLQARYDGLDDIVATAGQVFLGLTFDCARCHDHKIDPIPQKDYYRLVSFFHNINHYRNGGPTDERPILPTPEVKAAYEQKSRALEAKKDGVQAQLTAIEQEFRTLYDKEKKKTVQQPDLDDLHYRFYRDTWTKLPDFAALKHEESGRLPRNVFDLSPKTRNEAFGFVFEGVLIVPADGKYTFYLDSDDGSRLTINGRMLLEYDGIHDIGKEQTATVGLPKGRLPIKLEYFQNLFGMGLYVAWSGPGFGRRLLSAPVDSERSEVQNFALLFKTDGPRLLGKERFGQHQKLKKELDALKKQKIPAEMALCVTETSSKPADTFVLLRGNPHVKGPKVEPAFPVILSGKDAVIPQPPAGAKTTGRRLALANWIVAPDNPLSARVMANRLWQFHFGRGIVRSPNDFGLQGTRPTHPELLDWLASEFIAQGWRMKAMHRLIMTSSAYRMSSRGDVKALAADPANDLFWRFDMRRLSAEEIRDSILSVTGSLNLKMYGPGVYPEIPKEVLAGQSRPGFGWGKSPIEEQNRRSVYVHVKRSLLLPILESFDIAETDRSTPVRFSTTQPTQSLAMLNGEFLNKQADVFAGRLRHEAGKDIQKQVKLALALARQRPPTDADVQRGIRLIEALRTQDGASEEAALKYFCLMVLNLNEFVYLD